MSDERQLVDLVGQLYDAAADPDRAADLSSILAPHFGTTSSVVHTCTKSALEMRAVLSATDNFDRWAGSAYAAHYHDRNVWFQRGIRKGPSVVVICEELVPHRELLRSEWYDYCQKLDWFHCLGIGVSIAEDLVGGIGFHRPRHARPFDEEDRRKAQLLLPHVERVLQLQHRIARLTGERDVALSLVDGLLIGILFVGANGRLLFANRIAEHALRNGKGLSINRGRLRAVDHEQQDALDRLIGEAAVTSSGKGIASGGVLPLPREAGPPLTVLVSPFRSETLGYGPAQPVAVVIFSDPDNQKPVSERALMQGYGLTKAEARLLSALLSGEGLSAYARKAGISINTAKTQMRHIFWKTGHDRQVDLVRTIMTDPVMRLSGRGRS
jgi:DNA-binding CsgD family transcriptional regulator